MRPVHEINVRPPRTIARRKSKPGLRRRVQHLAFSVSSLEVQLFTAVGTKQRHRHRSEPDWAEVHRELKRKYVTLQISWDE